MTKQRLGFLFAFTSILITGSAIAQTKPVKPPTIPCVDAVTGAVKIKNKCNTRLGEYVLNVAQLLSAIPDSAQGPQGPAGPQGDPGAPGQPGPAGWTPLNCSTWERLGATTDPSNDVLEIPVYCPDGYFLMTHGIAISSLDSVVNGAILTFRPGATIPSGIAYRMSKVNPELPFTYEARVKATCCPLS